MKKWPQFLLKNARGQVAIFVALIFQVLFVFFAMIVNVGLLVHHKINLQNSVDFAAYYGAMKQAEMLNAIAHVNYQIRQSYKLLTFRYQQLGSAGTAGAASNQHPYLLSQAKILRDDDVPLKFDTSFCLPYSPVDLVLPSTNPESYCKRIDSLTVPVPGIPNWVGSNSPFIIFQNSMVSAATTFQNQAYSYCQRAMAKNWFEMVGFIGAYKMDIANRKKLLLALSNEISKDDPLDIQGESIKEGVYKTFYRNLTDPNREGFNKAIAGNGTKGFEFKFINSLAIGRCGAQQAGPPGWLKEVFIFPMYSVFDGQCGTGANTPIVFAAKYLNNGSVDISQNIPPQLQQQAKDMAMFASEFPSSDPNQLLYRSSIGFEKDPWCVGYVGVSATATPKIPFSPSGAVTMKATAFAKPFGGRIGPWYGTKWDHGMPESNSTGDRTDLLLPVRVAGNQVVGASSQQQLDQLKKEHRLFPNHSRYMGDQIGVVSELTIAHFAQAIFQRVGAISLDWYNHLPNENMDDKNINGDILAWDSKKNQSVPMRDLELNAIAPDQFDTANYSIDPDFYNNYLTKIQKGYGSKLNFLLRGDLGSRMQGSEEDKRFSVRNQIEKLMFAQNNLIDGKNKLTYYLSSFGQLLTSWQQQTPDNYLIDPSHFGKCLSDDGNPSGGGGDKISQKASDSNFFTMGSCKNGGRTGYSVKLVDGKFLSNTYSLPGQASGSQAPLDLGGEGVGGMIDNPPPAGF